MARIDQVQRDCPGDVVDHLLWRNAQAILRRHVVHPDGTCQWCGHHAPCSARQLAERAQAVAVRVPARREPVVAVADQPPARATAAAAVKATWSRSQSRDRVDRRSSRQEAIAGNDFTRLLPLLSADSELIRGGRPRNERAFD